MNRNEKILQKIPILKDEYFQRCLTLAFNSKGDERYGSILVKNEKIMGEGFNRATVHKKFKLERKIRQGYCNHAEVEALLDSLKKQYDVFLGDIYCAGYFKKEDKIFFQNEYTCTICPPHLETYGIKNIFLPTPEGWVKRPLDKAKEESKKFRMGTHKNRLIHSIKGYKFKNLEETLKEIFELNPSKI